MTNTFRIVVLGPGGVGKTCVILRFLRNTFDPEYITTIQDTFEKTICLNGTDYRLSIVDTAGQLEMQSITNLAIKSGDAFILVYSCTSSLSFHEISDFHEKILKLAPEMAGRGPKIVLAGNKCDQEDDRAVTTEMGRSTAREMNCPFFECSALSNHNIASIFEASLRQLLGIKETPARTEQESDGHGCSRLQFNCCNVA
jgi:small GTP-binding protein